MPGPQPALGGARYGEWLSEAAGTALLLAIGFSIVGIVVSPRSPVARAIPGQGLRFLIVGVAFGSWLR